MRARYTRAMPLAAPARTGESTSRSARLLAEQAFSRAAGAPLTDGNALELLIDAEANFDAWHDAIATARNVVLFENYIFKDDSVGRAFRDSLIERARAGVTICVLHDWLGCLGLSGRGFWAPLLEAGGMVRTFNPPAFTSPLGWLSRDHRKLLVVDDDVAFLGGVCVSATWLGDPARGIPPWRDTGVGVRGPAVAELARAFAEIWQQLGDPLPHAITATPEDDVPAGTIALRVVATVPNTAGLYRLDQLIAAMARRSLWVTDAYYVGIAPYVQSLIAAVRDGVDVRLLVPGTSDVPAVGMLSRAGYRPLIEAGVRVFEWNGSMLHAKTAVADGRWARIGSSNLNLASWIGNCEIDIAVEDAGFAACVERQFEADLAHATEIVIGTPRAARGPVRLQAPHRGEGSSGRAAASALRLANSMGAAITSRRALGPAERAPLLIGGGVLLALAIIAIVWPRLVAWPGALLTLWFAASLLMRGAQSVRKHPVRRLPPPEEKE